MDTQLRNQIRDQVLSYVRGQTGPVEMKPMVESVLSAGEQHELRDTDVLEVVLPMISSGMLQYTSGLRVKLGKPIASKR